MIHNNRLHKSALLVLSTLMITSGCNASEIGFGTWPLKGSECTRAIEQALDLGYRIIDTATFYENFSAIGNVLQKYDRHTLRIISKVWPHAQRTPHLHEDLKRTLRELNTPYLDVYLLHWPLSSISIGDITRDLKELIHEGLIHSVGLSNVTVNHIQRALEVGFPITCVQVEMNPFFYDPELIAFCHARDIQVQAWGPLGRGRALHDALLCSLGKKYGKTASQIALRWILQHGCLPLPGSSSIEHMQDNLDCFDFILSDEDMALINARAAKGARERVGWKAGLGFIDEFDFSYIECWPI